MAGTRQPRPARQTPAGDPRSGTISPCSSKATDIAHNCGLQQVNRLERRRCLLYKPVRSPMNNGSRLPLNCTTRHDRKRSFCFR
ncbi:hypothetical protein ACNKHN_14850 [Shigella flexneri]